MNGDLETFGRLVREHVDVASDDRRRLEQRARLIEASQPGRRRASPWALALICTVAAILSTWGWLRPGADAALRVAADGRDVVPGSEPSIEARRELHFSDGSQLKLETAGTLRVTDSTPRGAMVELLDGRAEVVVVPRDGSRWRLSAGPYVVHVVGTQFDLAWDDQRGRLELEMTKGQVRVTGPRLGRGKWLKGSERFSATVEGWNTSHRAAAPIESEPEIAPRFDAADASREPESLPDDARSVDADRRRTGDDRPRASHSPPDPERAKPTRPTPKTRRAVPKPSAPIETLEESVRRGDYAAALTMAERRGVDDLLRHAPATELSALADAARYSGRPALARRALTALRARFPESPSATSASFVLGRLEQGANPRQALSWYETYLRESPGGPLALEARGRRLLLLEQSGSAEAGRAAALDYLERYPTGPHARLARELLSSREPAE